MSQFGFETSVEEVVSTFASRVSGRVFLITGTSAKGLGANAAIALARARPPPKQLILVSRNKSKVNPVIAEIESINSDIKTDFVSCSLDDLESVRAAVSEIDRLVDHIDVLINNAGVMAIHDHEKAPDGTEKTLASNHVGHFLLTNLLLGKLVAASPEDSPTHARIVNLTSHGHEIAPFDFSDPDFRTRPYNPWAAYGQSKTANILFTVSLASSALLQKHSIRSYAVHPGGIYDTGLTTHLAEENYTKMSNVALEYTGHPFTIDKPKTLSQGTSSIVWAALDPVLDEDRGDGVYVEDCHLRPAREYASSSENASKLWAWSEKKVGQGFSI